MTMIGQMMIWLPVSSFLSVFKMAATSAFSAFASFTEKSSNNQENWQDANAALLELDKGNQIFYCILFALPHIALFFRLHVG